jgi:hypothetical protein
VIYLFTLAAYGVKRGELAKTPSSFDLGRKAIPIVVAALIWDIIVLVCLTFPSDFSDARWLIIGVPVVAALWYLLIVRRRVQLGQAGPASARASVGEGVRPRT